MLEVLLRRSCRPVGRALSEVGRVRERRFCKAILAVDGVPDLPGALAAVPSEALRVLCQTDVVALGRIGLVLGDTVVSIVALVIVFDDAALANIVAQLALKRPVRVLAPGLLAGMPCVRAFKLAQLACAPDLWDVFFIVERLDSTANVGTEAVLLVPERTLFIKKIESIMGKVIGRAGQVFDSRSDFCVESFECSVGGAGVVDNGLGGDLASCQSFEARPNVAQRIWNLRDRIHSSAGCQRSRLKEPAGQRQRGRSVSWRKNCATWRKRRLSA